MSSKLVKLSLGVCLSVLAAGSQGSVSSKHTPGGTAAKPAALPAPKAAATVPAATPTAPAQNQVAAPANAQTQANNAQPAAAQGDDWMNFGIDESIVDEAPKKKAHALKGQYFRLDVGFGETMPIEFKPESGIFVPDTKKDGDGPPTVAFVPNSAMGRTRPELNTEAGIRVSAVAGYNFVEYAGVEIEIAAQYARLGTVDVPASGEVGGGGTYGGNQSYEVGGSLWQIPVLANFVLQYPNRWNLTPFAGIGGGLVFMYTTIESESTPLFGVTDGGTTDNPSLKGDRASGTVIVPAWQCFGGLRWDITKDIGIHGMYRYMATSDFSYNGELDGIEFDGAQSTSYSGGITFRY